LPIAAAEAFLWAPQQSHPPRACAADTVRARGRDPDHGPPLGALRPLRLSWPRLPQHPAAECVVELKQAPVVQGSPRGACSRRGHSLPGRDQGVGSAGQAWGPPGGGAVARGALCGGGRARPARPPVPEGLAGQEQRGAQRAQVATAATRVPSELPQAIAHLPGIAGVLDGRLRRQHTGGAHDVVNPHLSY